MAVTNKYQVWNSKAKKMGIALPWDGTCEYFTDEKYKNHNGLYIGEDGNIFYLPYGEKELALWCSARDLSAHLLHLDRIIPGGVMVKI